MMCLCRNFGMLRLTYHFRACKIVEHFPQTCRCISKALSSNAWLALCQHITWRSELLTQKKRYRSVRLQSNWGRHDPAGCRASRIRVSACFRGDRLTFWGVYAGFKSLRSLQQARTVAVISRVMRQRLHMPRGLQKHKSSFNQFWFPEQYWIAGECWTSTAPVQIACDWMLLNQGSNTLCWLSSFWVCLYMSCINCGIPCDNHLNLCCPVRLHRQLVSLAEQLLRYLPHLWVWI